MYSVLVILMVAVSVLMCFIVIIQESKGGGLASGFASSNQIMGVRKTTDFIEKSNMDFGYCYGSLECCDSILCSFGRCSKERCA